MTGERGSPAGQRAKKRIERFRRGKIRPGPVQNAFTSFASRSADLLGSHWAFAIAVVIVLVWAVTGPIFGLSDVWMLIINTVTTIGTFLMVFLIQNTQNRDAKAMHLKLDELLRATPRARQEFMEAEDEDLQEILREKRLVDRADPAPPKNGRAEKRDNAKERKAG
jgi:low affinity Fe/Cu permease